MHKRTEQLQQLTSDGGRRRRPRPRYRHWPLRMYSAVTTKMAAGWRQEAGSQSAYLANPLVVIIFFRIWNIAAAAKSYTTSTRHFCNFTTLPTHSPKKNFLSFCCNFPSTLALFNLAFLPRLKIAQRNNTDTLHTCISPILKLSLVYLSCIEFGKSLRYVTRRPCLASSQSTPVCPITEQLFSAHKSSNVYF